MTKRELIDIISKVNRKATRDFLAEFSEHELADYMRQLAGLGLMPDEYDPLRDASTNEAGWAARA